MDPASYNITIPQYGTFIRTFQLRDSTGAPLNMVGYKVQAEVWTSGRVRKLAECNIEWIDRATGRFSISLTPEQTGIINTSGFWDLLIIYPNGTKEYWLRGRAALAVGYTTE